MSHARTDVAAASERTLAEQLAAAMSRSLGRAAEIGGLRRLQGGANQEIWRFEIDGEVLVLRRSPPGAPRPEASLPLGEEGKVAALAGDHGVTVPRVHHILTAEDGLGEGYVMAFVTGETLGSRIVRRPELADARAMLARQCGTAMARINAISPFALPALRRVSAQQRLDAAVAGFREAGRPRPVFEFAARWLAGHLPSHPRETLVHGDFRNGNIVVGEEGLRAILDWEGASMGDPMQDLAWICVNSWRFGAIDHPVGGFGTREDLYAGYEAAGGVLDRDRLLFWEVMGTLRWGVSCVQNLERFERGDATVERAMIARRASETEIDLLHLLAPRS